MPWYCLGKDVRLRCGEASMRCLMFNGLSLEEGNGTNFQVEISLLILLSAVRLGKSL